MPQLSMNVAFWDEMIKAEINAFPGYLIYLTGAG